MARYASVWWTVTGMLGAVGLAAAWTAWTPSAVAMVFIVGLVMGVTCRVVVHVLGTPAHPARVIAAGVKAGAVVVAVGGLTVPVGLAVLPAVLVVAVSSPRAVAWLLHRRAPEAPGDAASPAAQAGDRRGAQEAGPLTDRALCRAWRKSYFDLAGSRSLAASLHIVQARQGLLDELERRNPHGLSAWLDSGARAAGDPSRFIVGARAARRNRSV